MSFSGEDAGFWPRRRWFESTRGSQSPRGAKDARPVPNRQGAGSTPAGATKFCDQGRAGCSPTAVNRATRVRVPPPEPISTVCRRRPQGDALRYGRASSHGRKIRASSSGKDARSISGRPVVRVHPCGPDFGAWSNGWAAGLHPAVWEFDSLRADQFRGSVQVAG